MHVGVTWPFKLWGPCNSVRKRVRPDSNDWLVFYFLLYMFVIDAICFGVMLNDRIDRNSNINHKCTCVTALKYEKWFAKKPTKYYSSISRVRKLDKGQRLFSLVACQYVSSFLTMGIHLVVLVGLNHFNTCRLWVATFRSAVMDVNVAWRSRKTTVLLRRCACTPFTTTDNWRASKGRGITNAN